MTCCPVLTAALETFRERASRHADVDPECDPYRLGLSDAYGDAAGVLEQLVSPPWPVQPTCHPDELPIGDAR